MKNSIKCNTLVLLQTGKLFKTGEKHFRTSNKKICIGFNDGTTECGKIIDIQGQEIILTEKNFDLITCEECKERAMEELGIPKYKKVGWFTRSYFL